MHVPLVDLRAQYRHLKPEIDAAIQRVIANTTFVSGPEVEAFETAFAAYCGASYAVGVASGTAALHLVLLALGIGPGDEVITTPFTFIATAETIAQTGARPVFVDIDPRTYNLDPEAVAAVITPRTKAILPVHLYGQPAEMDPLRALARQHGLWLIEDAAQAHGAEYRGTRTGTLGDAACYSFYPSKNLGAYGDGGAVVTNNAHIAEKVRRLRDHGRVDKYVHQELGYGQRLDGIQAAILNAKLPHLDAWNEARRQAAYRYNALLSDLEVVPPYEVPHVRHVYHCYVVRTPRRDEVLAHLRRKGIGAGVHYPLPLHLQPALAYLGLKEGAFPVAEEAARQVLTLPLFPEISARQQERVVAVMREVIG